VDHLKSEPIFIQYLENSNIDNLLFASPDVGGVKRARNFSRILGKDFVTCSKYRKKANEIAEMNVIGDVEGFNVVLVDDMVDTAGTLCKAAEVIMAKGAKSVRALCTHAVLSGKAYENIEKSQLTELVVCDTIPLKEQTPKIKVVSTAKLFARALRNTHEHRSISAMFGEE
jgi:ribose-phosphate pyrophosphokinase